MAKTQKAQNPGKNYHCATFISFYHKAPPTDPDLYTAITFKMRLDMEYQWILVVSQDIRSTKKVNLPECTTITHILFQYLRQCFKEATEELFQDFSFEKEKLTVEIEEPAQPGWIIEPFIQPCIVNYAFNHLCLIMFIFVSDHKGVS